jgi:hypothetical protein
MQILKITHSMFKTKLLYLIMLFFTYYKAGNPADLSALPQGTQVSFSS